MPMKNPPHRRPQRVEGGGDFEGASRHAPRSSARQGRADTGDGPAHRKGVRPGQEPPSPHAARLRRGQNAGEHAGHLDRAVRPGLKARQPLRTALFHSGVPSRLRLVNELWGGMEGVPSGSRRSAIAALGFRSRQNGDYLGQETRKPRTAIFRRWPVGSYLLFRAAAGRSLAGGWRRS